MKTRNILKIFLVITSFLVFIALKSPSLSYSTNNTHPALTEEIGKFFNGRISGASISAEEIEWMRKGAIDEDEPLRYINHFYDPVHNVGWTGKHFGNLSQEQGYIKGAGDAPKPAIASISWAVNQEYQSAYGRQYGNQTWQKAIKSYLDKDKKSAFIALGHILHLVEDLSVPDHVRDDTHAGIYGDPGSPYESYAKDYTNFNKLNISDDLIKQNRELINFQNLADAFNYLANYSNKNFFSEDTISNEEFREPGLENLPTQKEGESLYLYNSGIYLVKIKIQGSEKIYTTSDDNFVLPSYRSRLFPQAVLVGASVLDLFFKEVEKYQKQPELLEQIIADSNEPFFQALKHSPTTIALKVADFGDEILIGTKVFAVNAFNNFQTAALGLFGSANDLWNTLTGVDQPASIIASLPAPLAPSTMLVDAETSSSNKSSQGSENTGQAQDAGLEEDTNLRTSQDHISIPATPRVASDETPGVSQVPSQTSQTTTVVGSSADTNLRPSQGHILVPAIPPESKPAPAGASFTPSLPNPGFGGGSLESSLSSEASAQEEPPPQDTTAPNPPVVASPADFSSAFTSADISFSGTAEARSIISNDFNSATTTADENGLWSFSFSFNEGSTTIKFFAKDAAGNVSGSTDASLFVDSVSPTIQTFSISECAASLATTGCLVSATTIHLSWQSSASDLDYFELTNNGETSATTSTSTVISVSDNSTNTFSVRVKDVSGNWSNASTTAAEISLMPVVINEIAWAGTSGHSEDEWIELYNRASKEINLNNWILYSQTDFKPYINLTGTIPANGYYLIERTNDTTVSDVLADWKGSFGSTDGGGSGLANTGEVLILSHASTTIDQTPSGAWPGGDSNIYRTMERYEPDSSGSDSSNWGTNNIVIKNGKNADNQNLNATPKARNSANYLINKNNPALSSNLTLAKSNSPYLVDNTLMNIGAAATLTIEPGVVIKFYNDAGFSVFGKIISRGTETDPIIFESFDNNYWYGVDVFAAGSVFDHSTFRKGGKWYNGTGKSMANLFIKDFSAAITNSIFEYSKVYGLKLENSNSTISNNTIGHNNNENDPAGYNAGLAILNGSPSVQSNSFQNNRRGIYSFSPLATINANSFSSNTQEAILSSGVPANFTNNSGSGNTVNGIFLSSGDIAQAGATTTLKANPLPYAFDSGLNIPANSGLVVESGVNARASGGFFGGQLNVHGNLVFNGVNSGDIVFSSGGSSPAAGDWRGIRVYGNSNIKGATFKHADKAISYYNSPIKLENIKFESNNLAVYADGASAGQTYAGQSITALLIEFINQIATTSPVGLW